MPTIAPFGPFVSKNHFAGWTEMAALLTAGLALGLADEARRRGRDWTTDARAGGVILAVVASLSMALAALASLSRGGTLALAAGAFCLLALRLGGARGRGALVATLVPTLVLGAVLVGLVPQEAHERMRSLSGASFRLDTWKDTLRLAASSPLLGHGLGAFHDAYPRFKRGHGIVRVEHAENDYLETLAETGALGLGLALAGLALARRERRARAGPRAGAWWVAFGRAPWPRSPRSRCIRSSTSTCAFPRTPRSPRSRRGRRGRAAGARPRPLSRPLAAALACRGCSRSRPPPRGYRSGRGCWRAPSCKPRPRPACRRCGGCGSSAPRQRSSERCAGARPTPNRGCCSAFTHQALGRPDTAAAFARHALAARPGAARPARSRGQDRGRALTVGGGVG